MDKDFPDRKYKERDYEEERDFLSSGQDEENAHFPSWRMVISLYAIGALVSLVLAFNPALDSLQTTNCLLISWLLALGALGMSIFCETPQVDEVE